MSDFRPLSLSQKKVLPSTKQVRLTAPSVLTDFQLREQLKR